MELGSGVTCPKTAKSFIISFCSSFILRLNYNDNNGPLAREEIDLVSNINRHDEYMAWKK